LHLARGKKAPSLFQEDYDKGLKFELCLNHSIPAMLESIILALDSVPFSNGIVRTGIKENCKERFRHLLKALSEVCRQGDMKNRPSDKPVEPSLDYEIARRKLKTGVVHLWGYFKESFEKNGRTKSDHNKKALESAMEVMAGTAEVDERDGFKSWRLQEAKELSDRIQDRLERSQSPGNCEHPNVIRIYFLGSACFIYTYIHVCTKLEITR
jgi:hypothetical protein